MLSAWAEGADAVTIRLLHGDCRTVLSTLDADSFDSAVTDPPYHLTAGKKGGSGAASVSLATPAGRARITTGFMGKAWDGGDVAFQPETWAAVLRVMKPGAFLIAFGGTRTYHRLVCAIEDAGFEVRDMLAGLYGSGFPKSTDKAKIPEAWKGWNTALKPAIEPICLARKPMVGTLAENLTRYGAGALWIDGCRVATDDDLGGGAETGTTAGQKHEGWIRPWIDDPVARAAHAERVRANVVKAEALGRWPANVIHDGSEEVIAAFPQSDGQIADTSSSSSSRKTQNVYGAMRRGNGREGELSADSDNEGSVGFKMKPGARRGDTGSAARFFWSPKASRADRNDGLQGLPAKPLLWSSGEQNPGAFQSPNTNRSAQNHHPTVKPTDLMRYLCKLVTPPGGHIIDPFAGSGSTLKAAELEGFKATGIELDAEYIGIARRRIASDAPLFANVESPA